jgi:small subunit ribosomal protein S1
MVSKDLIRRYDLGDDELDSQLSTLLGSSADNLDTLIGDHDGAVERDQIVPAKVLEIDDENGFVLVDIGGKAEAPIPLTEFEDEIPEVGSSIEVFYRGDDRHTSVPSVSKREADRERAWAKIVGVYEPGDIIEGEAKKLIKGGLLVQVDGVQVFMPASQIDIRRVANPADFIGTDIRAKIVKIDEERRNIVISRRQLLEEERMEKRSSLLSEIEEGQVRTGEVKNIADFGAFVDLGGMDGLLHVTDMSYGRIKHPREMVRIGDLIEVYVLSIDRERNRVALSLKALTKDPWDGLAERFPVGTTHEGRIANIVPYGLFVELEAGVEGLVHVTELSWTQKNPNPEGEFEKGDSIQVFVKAIDFEKKEMSLSVREVEGNPWDRIAEHYAPGTVIEATVKNLASYGAFVEIEDGIDGLLHNSDFHWTRKIQHPSEIVHKGDRIQCVVLQVDREKQRISLGMKQLTKNPWEDYIPSQYHVGDMLAGVVTKHIAAGCFVKLEDDLEAFMHYSSLPQEWHENPETKCIPGLKVEVRVVRVDCGEERIGLNFIHADFDENEEVRKAWAEAQEAKAARKAARQAAKEAKADEEAAEEDSADDESTADDGPIPKASVVAPAAPAEVVAETPAEPEAASEPEGEEETKPAE